MELRVPQAVEVLERTPGTLRALMAGVSDAWVSGDEGPETFSPRDVVGHLIVGEETDWIPRLDIILEHGEQRPFTPFDRFAFRAWIGRTTTADLLNRFARLRGQSLDRLKSAKLTEDDLARRGTHPGLGTVTLGQLIASWAVHDLGHIGQMVRTMARQYREAVGPWRAYLSVLDQRS